MDNTQKLALSDEQKQIVNEFIKIVSKLAKHGISLAECNGGLYAYNNKEVDCFNVPYDAACDGSKIDIFVATDLQCIGRAFDSVENECIVSFIEQ